METTQPSEITNISDVLEKRKKHIRTMTTLIILLSCLFISPPAYLGAAMGGGLPYLLVACAPIVILVFRKKPSISLSISLILMILFYMLDLRDISQGRSAELSVLTGLMTLISSLQIFSIFADEHKLDEMLAEVYSIVIVALLAIFSILVVKSESFVFTLFN